MKWQSFNKNVKKRRGGFSTILMLCIKKKNLVKCVRAISLILEEHKFLSTEIHQVTRPSAGLFRVEVAT